MQKRLTTILVLMALAALLCATYALADPVAPTTLTNGTATQRNLSLLAAQTVNAQGGYVTPVNISALAITQHWQGYYGDVTGTIVLADGNNETMYNWSMSTVTGEIYATRDSTPTWAGVSCADVADINTEDTYLNMTGADADSVNLTFDYGKSHPAFSVGATSIAADSCAATNAFDDTGAQVLDFFQVLLEDGTSSIIYATVIDDGATGFDSGAYDFELMVGEDEEPGSAGVTAYYFWVELGS